MRYLLLIYSEETTAAPDPAQAEQVMNEYWAYSNAGLTAGQRRISGAPIRRVMRRQSRGP